MKTPKCIMVALLLVIACISPAEEKKKKEYVRLDKTSSMKKYNPNAVWRKVDCKHCNGTGHKTKKIYDAKKNKTYKILQPCHYCKGKGTCGMSKK